MAKGLDVGTMNITCAQREEDKIVFTQQRNTFVQVEYSDIAERMLSRSEVLHIRRDGEVFIVGEDALNFANIFNTETRRPMSQGILSRKEKSAIPMLQLIIERLLGEPGRKGEPVYVVVPANPVDADLDALYHSKTVTALVDRLGYAAHPINEGMALVYSELQDNNFTGMGISWGAGMTNVCLSYCAVPVMQFSVGRGGDWIDRSAAAATGLPVDKVTWRKERGLKLDFGSKVGDIDGALNVYYENHIDYVVQHIAREVKRKNVDENLQVPVAIAGGTCQPAGFDRLLAEKLQAAGLPFQIADVRRSDEPIFSPVRGALVAALSEEGGETPIKAVKRPAQQAKRAAGKGH